MNANKLPYAVAACVAFALFSAQATTIDFRGTVSTDLSVADNWDGGVLPGDEDVALVDFAVLGGAMSLTNSADLSLGGLVLTNVPPEAELWGTNEAQQAATTLTIGAGGMSSYRAEGAKSNLTFNVNLATSCEQAWSFPHDHTVTFNGTISGTASLSITNDHYVIHAAPPGYGGKITYGYLKTSYRYVRLSAKGSWAQDVSVVGGRMELAFTDTAAWSEIFPGRSVRQSAQTLITLPGTPTVTFGDGDFFHGTGGMLVLDKGALYQDGGAITASVQVGYSVYPSVYEMSGGMLHGSTMVVGNSAATSWYTNQEFRLKGGNVEFGDLHMGWKGGGPLTSHSDVQVDGGTITLTDSTAIDKGMILAWNAKDANNPRARIGSSGAFRQTGGVVKTPRVSLGGYVGSNTNSWSLTTNSYFTLSLDGGTLDVGSCGFSARADRWNAREEGDTTGDVDSRYRMSFKSGTLAAYAPFTSELDFVFVSNSAPFVVNTRANDVVLAAPVWGSGDVEKTGSGALVVADASRHRGAITVSEGTLKVLGAAAASDEVSGATCWVWRADDAVSGLSDGAEVTSWSDSTGARTATYDGVSKDGVSVTKPTAALNAFNGHAGVEFNQSALMVSATDNPLGGSTNWTLCVVMKTPTVGLTSGSAWYMARGVVGREEGGVQNDWGLVFDANGHFGAGLGVAGIRDNSFYTSERNYADDVPHVVFYSLDCSGALTLTVDGEVVRKTVALNETTKSPRKASKMYFGVQNIGDSGPKAYALIGTVAEFRFYPDRALSDGERAGLGASLAAKYGASSAVAATGGGDVQNGEMLSSADATKPDDGAAAWDADSLDALEDGAAVETWTAEDGTRTATVATGRLRMSSSSDLSTEEKSTVNAPVLVKDALNGHHVVRFNGSHALGVSADDSPVSGATAWTVAMVFRTSDSSSPGSSRQFYQGRGLFGAELPLNSRADWGVTFWNEHGRVLAGYGGKDSGNSDHNIVSRAWDLNDGEPHILVATFDTDAGIVNVAVDGVWCPQKTTKCSSSTPREAMRVLIGAMNADYFFRGDVAAFRMYGRVLSRAEIDALIDAWTDRYAVPPQPKYPCAAGEATRTGLGSKSISVASGATLSLPVAETAPFTLADGQTLECAGTVRGTLGVGTDGVLDLVSASPEGFDGLWLRDGATVRVSRAATEGVSVGTVKAEGAVTLDVTGTGSMPLRLPVFEYADSVDVSNATVTLQGCSAATTLAVDETRHQVLLVTAKGTIIIMR